MPPFLPQSQSASAIANLFILTLVLAAAVFLLVTVLVIVAILRFRSRPGQGEPKQNFGNRKLEIGWTIAPGILLIVLLGLSVRTSNISSKNVPATQPMDVIIIGHQWWWEVRYPKAGFVTANEIHLPIGVQVNAEFESADVIHDFWVPELGRKIDMIPGHPNSLVISVNNPGTYLGTCSEFCGAEHAWMRIRVIAQTPQEYNAWLQQQSQTPAAPTIGTAVQGAQLFQQLSCAACHTVAGTAAQGKVGPDLTHLASRETIGAGILDNNAGTLSAWLSDPQAIKPGINMPNLNLNGAQIGELVAYLETLK